MSGQEWAPGTVAVATVRGVPNLRVIRVRSQSGRWGWRTVELVDGGALWHDHGHVTDVRPLVVLDYSAAGFQRLVRYLRADNYRNLADQIEAQTRPPKPPEPTGLGAVVKDRYGFKWIRCPDGNSAFHWRTISRVGPWDVVDAVEVLSEGVA